MSRLASDALLLVTACLWGVTFVAQKDAVGIVPPLAFVAARFAVSALALAPLALLERRWSQRRAERGATLLALAIGLSLFLGTSLQQAGLETTSATNGGFLTACYVVLTPFVVWALQRRTPARARARREPRLASRRLAARRRGRAGFAPLDRRRARSPGRSRLGDGHRADPALPPPGGAAAHPRLRPICGLRRARGLFSMALETVAPHAFIAAAPAILFAGLVSGAVAYTLQIFAQARTPPAEAALILSLESVFAALAGAALLGERLTSLGVVGCALILIGAVAVETVPVLTRKSILAAKSSFVRNPPT